MTASPNALRIRRLAVGLVNIVSGPITGALRTGLVILITLIPKVHPA
ncbi:hypothetical protein [Mycobacterium haemophilum]|nr:hypothetical protein [Mycobacterium haemophilum]MCV7341414.1 hypothetical protein [Mycobacterium haemophilum DSM 44634]